LNDGGSGDGQTLGRVGRPHGLDGSFYLEAPEGELVEGAVVAVAGRETVVSRVAGTAARPLVRLSGVADRDAAAALRGERVVGARLAGAPAAGEWEVAELLGCEVTGLGTVRRVLNGPSCDVLEVGDEGVLVPLVSDAVKRVDTGARTIEVDRRFLGLE
jgi:16S rRNA processing protein RimM